MVRLTFVAWLAFLLAANHVDAADQKPRDETAEPLLEFELEVDGKAVPIQLDQQIELNTPEENTPVVLRVKPYRRFDFAGVSFLYPRQFMFEADLDSDEVTIWTIEGNDTTVMLFRGPAGLEPDEYRAATLESLSDEYGENNVRFRSTTLNLPDQKLKGTRLDVRLAGSRLHQDLYALPGEDNRPLLLIVQQSLGDAGQPTAESRRFTKLLQDSIQLPGRAKSKNKK